MSIFSTDDKAALRRPHVGRVFLVALELPSGTYRYHNGAGTVTLAGEEWMGVSDPLFGPVTSIGEIMEPRFGQAATVKLTLSGAKASFFAQMKTIARDIEGLSCDIWFAMVDQETLDVIIDPVKIFPKGRMTAPRLHKSGIGTRTIEITVESFWSGLNFPFGEYWSYAGILRRNAGDLGGSMMGVEVIEKWR